MMLIDKVELDMELRVIKIDCNSEINMLMKVLARLRILQNENMNMKQ